ncbi:FAD-dependent oxidoreductase [Pseudonocardia sp. TRM90224]|uniref:FAD-dependent oxidoreductase n=1 Tax=Pseudonocardia sp. TRM90224 TaxID=2812678 RepID=UPI0035A8C087
MRGAGLLDDSHPKSHVEGLAGICAILPLSLPVLNEAFIDRLWAGMIPYTPDGLPIIDRLGDPEGLVVAADHSDGNATDPVTGELVAALATGAEVPPTDVTRWWSTRRRTEHLSCRPKMAGRTVLTCRAGTRALVATVAAPALRQHHRRRVRHAVDLGMSWRHELGGTLSLVFRGTSARDSPQTTSSVSDVRGAAGDRGDQQPGPTGCRRRPPPPILPSGFGTATTMGGPSQQGVAPVPASPDSNRCGTNVSLPRISVRQSCRHRTPRPSDAKPGRIPGAYRGSSRSSTNPWPSPSNTVTVTRSPPFTAPFCNSSSALGGVSGSRDP